MRSSTSLSVVTSRLLLAACVSMVVVGGVCMFPDTPKTARADTVGGSGPYSFEVLTCTNAQSANAGTNDLAWLTLQTEPTNNSSQPAMRRITLDNPGAGERAAGGRDTYHFSWGGSLRDVRFLEAIRIDKRGTDNWAICALTLRWNSDILFRWRASDEQEDGNYVIGHPQTGPIVLNESGAPASFVRFTNTPAANIPDGVLAGWPRIEVRTCAGQPEARPNNVGVMVYHDHLKESLVVAGSALPNRSAWGTLADLKRFWHLGRLHQVSLSVLSGEAYCYDRIRLVIPTVVGDRVPWEVVHSGGKWIDTENGASYSPNEDVNECTICPDFTTPGITPVGCDTCVAKLQGFALDINEINAACAAGIDPVPTTDPSCDGNDQDCSGTPDEDYTGTPCGVGICRRYSTCANGAVQACQPGSPRPAEIAGNGLDDDCDGATDEATPEHCTDAADNDGDGRVDCQDSDCEARNECRGDPGTICDFDKQCDKGLACIHGTCLRPHCDNGIQDGDETGVDCGGSRCPACVGCESTCSPGEPTTPPPLDSLAFAAGTFTRATTATFEPEAGRFETARINELRWEVIGGKRMALFEGASTNRLKWSATLDRTPEWARDATPAMSVTTNAGAAPDNAVSAELLGSSQAGSFSPRQTASIGALPSTFSLYLRAEPETFPPSRHASGRLVLTNPAVVASANFAVDELWKRIDLPTRALAAGSYRFGLQSLSNEPAEAGVPAAPNFFAWGAQLEEQPFPTSYIPTTSATASRAADVLISTQPTWLRVEMWQMPVAPMFASNELRTDWRYTLISYRPGDDIALVNTTGRPEDTNLVVRIANVVRLTRPLTWERYDELVFTFDVRARQVTIAGAQTGNGTFTATHLSFPARNLRIGGALDANGQPAGGEAFAAIGEPRYLPALTEVCEPDPTCPCGNEQLDPGEQCDPSLDARCDGSCLPIDDPIVCTASLESEPDGQDSQCPDGQECVRDAGAKFGLPASWDICMPIGCNACGSVDSPCGACVGCTPSCEGKVCGGDLSDGCGGACSGVCDGFDVGCQRDSDCVSGFYCAIGLGHLFGQPAGTNICLPVPCADPNFALLNCGEPTSICGETCPTKPDECGERVCGTDRHGNSCGTCSSGQLCNEDGACYTPVSEPPPPDDVPPAVPPPPPAIAGALSASFAVTAAGTASYDIPIEVPPGRRGMQPGLSIHYDSGAPRGGSVAKGWSIQGLSAIARCPRTFALNGVPRGVRLDAQDRFCLAGQQLVSVNGDYGADGTEYRTELESFVRVKSFGNPSNGAAHQGPSYFKAWTKSGQVLTFGRSQEARILARVHGQNGLDPGTPVNAAWFVEKVEDHFGNAMSIAYNQIKSRWDFDEADNDPLWEFAYEGAGSPKTITYGANGSHSVSFEYRPYSDRYMGTIRGFFGGIGLHNAMQPLERIVTKVNGSIVRTYKFELDEGPDFWNLQSAQICLPHGGEEHCQPPTTFTYKAHEQLRFERETDDSLGGHVITSHRNSRSCPKLIGSENLGKYWAFPLTRNHDPFQDLYHFEFPGGGREIGACDYAVYAGTALEHSLGSVQANRIFTRNNANFNAQDGIALALARIIPAKPTDNDFDGVEEISVAGPHYGSIDFTGDGRPDQLICWSGAGFEDLPWIYATSTNDPPYYMTPAERVDLAAQGITCDGLGLDYDGDGSPNPVLVRGEGDDRELVALHWRGGESPFEVRSLGRPAFLADVDAFESAPNLRVIEANGDGIPDIVHLDEAEDSLFLYLGTGRGYARWPYSWPFRVYPGNSELFEYSFVMDSDGNGRQELYVPLNKEGDERKWMVIDDFMGYVREPWRQLSVLPYRNESHEDYTSWDWQKPTPIDFDGNGVDDLLLRTGSRGEPTAAVYRGGSLQSDKLESVTDGLGKRIDVTYLDRPSEQSGAYTAGTGCDYPQRCLQKLPHALVVAHTVSGYSGPFADPRSPQPQSATRRFEYTYEDARTDVRGRGWIGFARRTVSEVEHDFPGRTLSQTIYDYDIETDVDSLKLYAFASVPDRVVTVVMTENEEGLSVRTSTVDDNTWAIQPSDEGRPWVGLDSTIHATFEAVGDNVLLPVPVASVGHVYNYDLLGNVTLDQETWSDGRRKTTVNGYVDDSDELWSTFEPKWLVGVLTSTTVTGTDDVNAAESETKKFRTEFSNHNHGGLPRLVETKTYVAGFPIDTENSTTIFYDDYGNEQWRRLSGRDAEPQFYTVVYDDYGLFPIEVTNGVHADAGLGSTKVGYDIRTGALEWVAKPDGSWVRHTLDALGRVYLTRDSSGQSTTTAYSMNGRNGGPLEVTVSGVGQPTRVVEYNAFTQPISERTTIWVGGGTSRVTVSETGYDARGRLKARGVPHFEGSPALAAHFLFYDELGRLTEERHPWQQGADGPVSYATTRHFYGGRSSLLSASIPWTESRAVMGQLTIDSTDAHIVTATDARGNAVVTIDALGNQTRFTYGAFDHLKRVSGPAGQTDYRADEFGRLREENDAETGLHTYRFNGLGLLRQHQHKGRAFDFQYDGLGRMLYSTTPDGTYRWEWDGDGADRTLIGHLERESLESASLGNSSTRYEYHGPGAAPTGTYRTIEGVEYQTLVEYDDLGRPELLRYPGGHEFAVRYEYATDGQLSVVEEAASDRAFWAAQEIDAFGNVVASAGPVLTTRRTYEPATGRLSTSRVSSADGQQTRYEEQLFYDTRGFVGAKLRPGHPIPLETYTHDAAGRLEHHYWLNKDDLYEYYPNGNLKRKPNVGELHYEGATPQQLTTTDSGLSFRYEDGFGNQTLREGAAGGRQELDYTAFNLPVEARIGPDGQPTLTIRYAYDASNRRIVQRAGSDATIYAGPELQRRINSGVISDLARVALPDGSAAEVLLGGDGEPAWQFLAADYQGSTVGVQRDGSDTFEQRTFDPFGYPLANTSSTSSSFTGHEWEAELGLINMQGRIYDPAVGRFLSPDPIVQAPTFSQSWNRYAYVFNNPLNLVDPSGFEAGYCVNSCVIYEPTVVVGYPMQFEDHVVTATPVVDNSWQRVLEMQARESEARVKAWIDAANQQASRDREAEQQRIMANMLQGVTIPAPAAPPIPAILGTVGTLPPGAGPPAGEDPWPLAIGATAVMVGDDASGIGAVDDLAIPVVIAAAAVADAINRTYVTYTLTNGSQIYVGRTSGFGTPHELVQRRFLSHHMRVLGFTNPTVDRAMQGQGAYAAIRGREQQMIDALGGVGSPNVGNRIRGVSEWNPLGRLYWDASNTVFGNIAPFTGRF